MIQAGAGALQDRTKLAALAAEADHFVRTASSRKSSRSRSGCSIWRRAAATMPLRPSPISGSASSTTYSASPEGRWLFRVDLGSTHAAGGHRGTVTFRPFATHAHDFSHRTSFPSGVSSGGARARGARAVATAQDLGDQYGSAFASAIGPMTLFLLRSDPRVLAGTQRAVLPALREAWFCGGSITRRPSWVG